MCLLQVKCLQKMFRQNGTEAEGCSSFIGNEGGVVLPGVESDWCMRCACGVHVRETTVACPMRSLGFWGEASSSLLCDGKASVVDSNGELYRRSRHFAFGVLFGLWVSERYQVNFK